MKYFWMFSVILLTSQQLVESQNFCRTPGYKAGQCISIFDCEYLLNIATSDPLSRQAIRFLQLSQCDAGPWRTNAPYVCCANKDDESIFHRPATDGTDAQSAISFPQDGEISDGSIEESQNTAVSVLPDRSVCGLEVIENRIYSGQNAEENEFPWLALLEYKKFNGEVSINCAGSLISRKYVLTACHCIMGDIISRIGKLTNVRLGDHDLKQSNGECAGRRCGNPHQFNEIDEIIPHERFNPRSIHRRNDIGLIRLKKAVKFNQLLRPICLPSHNEPPLNAGDTVYIIGFGRTLNSSMSRIKQKLTIPIFNFDECKRKFATKNVRISKEQICAGGEFSRDACDGDSGGPLQRFRNNWVAEGIVSFGNLCGLEGWPAIYTKVSSYLDWIEKHVRP